MEPPRFLGLSVRRWFAAKRYYDCRESPGQPYSGRGCPCLLKPCLKNIGIRNAELTQHHPRCDEMFQHPPVVRRGSLTGKFADNLIPEKAPSPRSRGSCFSAAIFWPMRDALTEK